MFNKLPRLMTDYLESPDSMCTYCPYAIIFLITSIAYGRRFECVFKHMTNVTVLSMHRKSSVAAVVVFL